MAISTVFPARLYPLQTYDVSEFWKSKSSSSTDALFFVIGVILVIILLIIVNAVKKKYNIPALTGASTAAPAPRRFSGFTLHRLASDIGLDRDQTKMLDFVFKSGGVADPEQTLSSPALLDQYFKRAYRLIERGSDSEEKAQEQLSVLFSTRNILESSSEGGNISSTRQVPDNSSSVLGVDGQSYPVRVRSGKGEHLIVECPKTVMGSPVKPARGSKVTLSFFTKSNKGFSFESRILGYTETRDGPMLQLLHSSQIKRLSQRRFRRRQMVIASSFYLVYLEQGGRGEKKMVVDKRRLTGNILDISLGGCSVKTNALVNSGTRLKIEFTQGTKTTVAALGQVLRTNRSGATTIMHVKFLKIPRRSMNAINAFVYEYAD
ncbi:MAG: PilZ domain-containing protein [Treponema sp.]|jgi:c-di-GMP-binding flagellar brake protein YcgR|nr:PilZ domain-containing protein [Treponema sp.]